ncbi:hypothetical protein [Pseudomonas sp. P9_31]|uniref:hypothetical protein n=1 Tax=Pseudomonas sp. P9_31 TaxID=3043448 RepID=UPI002A36D2C8|nr:hypothetical protein [Pseudomonas sp. P9_31]WPN55792.1 hypothetical protein QMK51_16560 [Pseudomonas sp. P9_31]
MSKFGIGAALAVVALLAGGYILYGSIHQPLVEDVDVSLLGEGKYYVFERKLGPEKYSGHLYVKEQGTSESGEKPELKTYQFEGFYTDAGFKGPVTLNRYVVFNVTKGECEGWKFPLYEGSNGAKVQLGFSLEPPCTDKIKDSDHLTFIQ